MSRLVRSLEPGPVKLSVVRSRRGVPEEITVNLASGVGPPAPPSNAESSAPPAAQVAPVNVRFERLADPLERAFTIEAPGGWRTVTGLARAGLVQVNPYLRSLSPDRMTYLIFGDPTFPTFLTPNPLRNTLWLREGSVSTEAVGGRSEIRRYQPGSAFARYYGGNTFASLCAGLKLTATRDRHDLARKIDSLRWEEEKNGTETDGTVTAGGEHHPGESKNRNGSRRHSIPNLTTSTRGSSIRTILSGAGPNITIRAPARVMT